MKPDYALEVAASQLKITVEELHKQYPELVSELCALNKLVSQGTQGACFKSHEAIAQVVLKYKVMMEFDHCLPY